MAFNNFNIVPWQLYNCWMNCVACTKSMHFVISHIYRTVNCCADKMANLGVMEHGSLVGILASLCWETLL